MVVRRCDSCRSAAANLYCSADSAFLCIACDSRVHAANKLACRHSRVWLCEVCEQSPAAVTCKADAASLCAACDLHVHSANPLARRHDRLPVSPFFDPPSPAAAAAEEEAEAATWILPDPKPAESPDLNSLQCGLEMDPYLDLEYGPVDTKLELYDGAAADGVVPAQGPNGSTMALINEVGPPDNYFEFDFGGSKPFTYSFNSQSLSHSVSSPSMEVGVVPDASVTADAPDPFSGKANHYVESTNPTAQVTGADREARVLRYREKRKNRKFEKTIRYASRKAYAETRPRIKGRFAKREIESISDAGYGVVPSF